MMAKQVKLQLLGVSLHGRLQN